MTTRTDIFYILGQISVLFSTLEAEIEQLICFLVNHEEEMLTATLIEGNAFARNLNLLKKISHFKDEELGARVNRILTLTTPLRENRNLFIHGFWDISSNRIKDGKISVVSSKIWYEDHGNHKMWRKGKSHTFTYNELHDFKNNVMRALKTTKELNQRLELET
ncbi:MAG: hypothetical protein ACYDFU_01570 [Nitrospirota bacterium]